jgi:hypothetical protein
LEPLENKDEKLARKKDNLKLMNANWRESGVTRESGVYSCLLLAVCSLIYCVRNVEKE